MQTQYIKRLFSLSCLALLGLILTLPAAAENGGGSQALESTPSSPFLELQPGDQPHHASLSLGRFALPLVALTNSDTEKSLHLQILALDKSGQQRRSLVAELEAGGRLSVLLEAPRRFASLVVVARGPFAGEVSDVHGERTARLETRSAQTAHDGAQKSANELCGGDWTLTCYSPSTCTYVSPAFSGEVLGGAASSYGHDVYWNLQFPIGNWLTTNGGCWVVWKESIGSPGCPTRAINCYGERYRVGGTIPF